MKVGNLVKCIIFRTEHQAERFGEVIGIIGNPKCLPFSRSKPDHYSDKASYVYWLDGDVGWFEHKDLEVISEKR